MANYVARDIDQSLTERLEFTERLAAAVPIELLGDPDRLLQCLRGQHDLNPLFTRGLKVVHASGRVSAGYGSAGAPRELLSRDTAELLPALLSPALFSPALLSPAHLTSPLADQADKMTRDDIPMAPLQVERPDEIGTLTSAFNRLVG